MLAAFIATYWYCYNSSTELNVMVLAATAVSAATDTATTAPSAAAAAVTRNSRRVAMLANIHGKPRGPKSRRNLSLSYRWSFSIGSVTISRTISREAGGRHPRGA